MLNHSMSPPSGANLQVWITIGILAVALISILIQHWRERDKEKKEITKSLVEIKTRLETLDRWENSVDAQLVQLFNLHGEDSKRSNVLEKNVLIINNDLSSINNDLSSIKEELLRRRSRKGAPISRTSPLKAATGAIDVLKNLNLLAQVDANISYIQDEIEKRSQTSTYPKIEDLEERYIEFVPGAIHGLIKQGKIDAKKIDDALNELEVSFPAVTYYGMLLLITAYIIDKYVRKKTD